MKYTPHVVSPPYLRDNQYEEGWVVVCEVYNQDLFDKLLEEYGEVGLSEFPSGLKVFYCKKEVTDEEET